MANKNEYKIQLSKAMGQGVIWVVRGDDIDELTNSMECAMQFLEDQGIGSAPTVSTVEQQDGEATRTCPIHKVPMTQHRAKNTDRLYWRHDTDDPNFVKDNKFDTVYCFGSVPK